jgi:hypothetical protein
MSVEVRVRTQHKAMSSGILDHCVIRPEMIGCTRLRAVSGILRTQRGRRGSGLGRLLAGTVCAGPALWGRGLASSTPRVRLRRSRPLWLISSLRRATPLWLNSSLHRSRPLRLNSSLRRPTPLWLNSSLRRPSPPWLNSSLRCLSPQWLNSGRRRALPTSHWSWVPSRAACWRAGSPARIATVVLAGVQWGGLGLAPLVADRRQHRASRGPSDARSRPSHVRG